MSVHAIVLAGGRSRRFGSDKLAAALGDGTILTSTIRAVSSVADAVIVAGPKLPDEHRAAETPVLQLDDREPFSGPLMALAGALELETIAADMDLVLVVGGDMPRLVPAVLVAMIDTLDVDPTIDAVLLGRPEAAIDAGPSEPMRRPVLPMVLRHRPASGAAREAVGAGQRSLQALVARLSTAVLPASVWLGLDPDGSTLTDVDTPADLERLG